MVTFATLEIGTVDLSAPTAAIDLERSLAATGFVQLTGHGVNRATFERFRGVCDAFFSLDTEVKTRFVHPDPAANRGYRAKGSEALSYSLGKTSPPDLFESFNSAPQPLRVHRLTQATPWPDAVVPGFSDAATAHFAEMRLLSGRLDELIDSILDIDWLARRSTASADMLASINYRPDPDGTGALLDGQQRMGAHSDYTTFTLLDADPVRGLQILGPGGNWVDVVPAPGALLMNVGDVLAMLTNDLWPSTLHRVVPMAAGGAPNRRSVAYFHYPNLDVEIAPLDSAIAAGEQPRYEPVTVESHLIAKIMGPKVHEPSTAASTVAGRISQENQ